MIGCTTAYLPSGVFAISTIFGYALKRNLDNTIERYKAQWVGQGFLEPPDVHYDPTATHAHVASDASLIVLLVMVVHHDLQLKQMDVKTIFLISPLTHEVWVWFPAGYKHPLEVAFAKLHKSLYGLK